MPLPLVQPARVRAAIGQNGERLRGPLVERERFGPVVKASKAFTVGANAVTTQVEVADRSRQVARETLALTRAMLTAHFFSDVLVGAGIGLLVARETFLLGFPQLAPGWF